MILYSIVPAEMVFQGSSYLEDTRYFEAEYMGVKIMAAQMPDNSFSVSRILSTCPKYFLDPALQPGMAVDRSKLKLLEKNT